MYFGESRAGPFLEAAPMAGADFCDSIGKDVSVFFGGK
jgi:hypothetical protein